MSDFNPSIFTHRQNQFHSLNKNNSASFDNIYTKSKPVKRSHSLKTIRSYNRDRLNAPVAVNSSQTKFNLSNDLIFQLEKHMLHSDLKRNSFRARNSTKNFVLNPIFDNETEDLASVEQQQTSSKLFKTNTILPKYEPKSFVKKYYLNEGSSRSGRKKSDRKMTDLW